MSRTQGRCASVQAQRIHDAVSMQSVCALDLSKGKYRITAAVVVARTVGGVQNGFRCSYSNLASATSRQHRNPDSTS